MRAFAELYDRLDMTTSTNAKVAAMVAFFASADPDDAARAVALLCGRRPRRPVTTTALRAWAAELSGHPLWLVEECYEAVGDLAETLALLVDGCGDPATTSEPVSLAVWVDDRLRLLRGASPEEQRRAVLGWWRELRGRELFLLNKLLTGAFRVGVSQRLVTRALAEHSGLDKALVAHRLMGDWQPSAEWFERLLSEDDGELDISRPYPFFLASPLESGLDVPGQPEDWLVEWKWDGIRAQLILREGSRFLWSRGEDLVTGRWPEVVEAARALPRDAVLDGELLAWDFQADRPRPFAELQRRINRKAPGRRLRREVPARFLCYDLLELDGEDLRERPVEERRAGLAELLAEAPPAIGLSPLVCESSWEALAKRRDESRERLVEGLMLKRRGSPYRVGRKRGDWWKWKIDPLTMDAVLVYAQRGHGRRAGLFTDYTFAVRDGDALVPVAKAYSGLSDAEIRELDKWIKSNTRERFGPVRAVPAEKVFEIAFEGIRESTRHKSGLAVRFPRMIRPRPDKPPAEIDSITSLRALAKMTGLITEPKSARGGGDPKTEASGQLRLF